jgi:hypothetical protein
MLNNYILIVALIIGITPFLFKRTPGIFNHFITIFHEVGHAVTSLLFRGQVKSIRINADGSGDTTSAHRVQGGYKLFRLLILLSGYSFPITTGIITFLSVFTNNYIAGFWVIVAVSAISIIFIRNLFGLGIVTIFALLVAIPYFFFPDALPYVIFGLSSLMLAGGIKDLLLISFVVCFRKGGEGSDFSLLRDEFYIPKFMGIILEWAFTLSASAFIFFLFNYLSKSLENQAIFNIMW